MSTPFSAPFRRIADGTTWVFLAEVLILPTGFITTVYLTRTLGPEKYGLFTLAITVFVWASMISGSLLSRATIKFVSEAENWQPVATTVFRSYLICGLGASVLLWLSAEPASKFLQAPKLEIYLKVFTAELIVLTFVQAHKNTLIGIGRFRGRALASAIRWPARLLMIVIFVEMGFSVTGAILGSLCATCIELIIYRFMVRPSLFSESRFSSKKLWSFATPLFFYAICIHIFGSLDVIALKAFGGTTAAAGIYGVAQNISIVPGLFASSFTPLLLSTLGHLTKSDQLETAREMGCDATRLVLIMLPFAAMTAGIADEIIELIFGSEFSQAAPLLSVLIFGKVALVMIGISTAIMIATGKNKWTVALAAPLLVLALPSHWILVSRFGSIGAAWVTTSLGAAGAMVSVWAIYKLWNILPPFETVLRSATISVLAYGIGVYWQTPGFWVILKLILIMFTIGTGFLLSGEFSAREIDFVRSLLKSRIQPKESQRI